MNNFQDTNLVKYNPEYQTGVMLESKNTFEEFFQETLNLINEERARQAQHVKMWAMLERRANGVTISDRCGYFSESDKLSNQWVDIYNEAGAPQVHPINIVSPTIRANTSTMAQANIAVDVVSKRENSETERAAEIGQRVADFYLKKFFTESRRLKIFDMVQKSSAAFVRLNYQRSESEMNSADSADSADNVSAVHECPQCGEREVAPEVREKLVLALAATVGADARALAGKFASMKCPDCGQKGVIGFKKSEKNSVMYDAEHELLSPFEVTVDSLGTQGGHFERGRFFEIHRLRPVCELEAEYPHMDFTNLDGESWCFALRQFYRLASGSWSDGFSFYKNLSDYDKNDLLEVREIYLSEKLFANRIEPEAWEITGADGRARFEVREEESIVQAAKRLYGDEYKGFLKFIVIGDRIIDVVPPSEAPIVPEEAVGHCSFSVASNSFWSMPLWDIVAMQDTITNLNTIMVEYFATNISNTIVADSFLFDLDDFEYPIVLSKKPAIDGDIRNHVVELPPPRLNTGIDAHMQMYMSMVDRVSGVTDPMRGIAEKGQPGFAQRMQRDQAVGLLTPALKNFAGMETAFTAQILRFAQQRLSDEQFNDIAAESGETWDADDLSSFRAADIKRHFDINYKEGSEKPQSRLDKEIQLNTVLTTLLPFIQNGLLPPDASEELIQKYCEFADPGFDLRGMQRDEEIATFRYRKLNKRASEEGLEFEEVLALQQTPAIPLELINEQLNAGIISPEEAMELASQTQVDILIDEILKDEQIYISPRAENHPVHIRYYRERIKTEAVSRRQNHLLTLICERMIEAHETAAVGLQQASAEAQIAANAPAADAARAEDEAARAGEQANAEHDRIDRALADEEKRRFEMDKMLLKGEIDRDKAERTASGKEEKREKSKK